MNYSPHSVIAVHHRPEWREWAVHPALSAWVLGYWEHVVREGTHTVRTLPDGCVDLTLDLSRPDAPAAYLSGAQPEPMTHEVRAPTRLFGARLHPLAASMLIGPRLDELGPTWLPLSDFLGADADELLRRAVAAPDAAAVVGVFDGFFAERLIGRTADPRLTASLAAIFDSEGRDTVSEIAHRAATSERTLHRLFVKYVGLSPKRFLRIVRLQAVMRRMEGQADFARLASELGYADQSHLTREMQALFGEPPTSAVRRLGPR